MNSWFVYNCFKVCLLHFVGRMWYNIDTVKERSKDHNKEKEGKILWEIVQ